MTYRRDAVLDYAREYYWRPCPDGKVYINQGPLMIANLKFEAKRNTGYETIFLNYTDGAEGLFLVPQGQLYAAKGRKAQEVRDAIMVCSYHDKPSDEPPDMKRWGYSPKHFGLNDCTHFTTECLIAGGFPAPSVSARQWAPALYTELANHHRVRLIGSDLSQRAAQAVIDARIMCTGDIVMYWSKTLGRHHAVVFLGDDSHPFLEYGSVTMHTRHQYGMSWLIGGGPEGTQKYSLFHVNDDDYHSWFHALWVGWWEITHDENVRYVYCDSDGYLARSWMRPKSAATPPPRGQDYWFANMKTRTMAMCVRKAGVEAVLTMTTLPITSRATGKAADGSSITAIKLSHP